MRDLKLIWIRRLQAVCCLFAVLLLLAPSAFAQTGLGTVTGTVRDPQKAVVRNANVTLTNTSTNITRKSVTNDEGIYIFGSVPLGPYTLVVESSGFKRWEGRLELQVGQYAVVDPVMQVGGAQETVNVTGAAPVLQTESGEVADVKDYQRIHQLPLNGRAITTLFDLTPGVEGGGNARVNGLKVGSLEITIDGVSVVDRFGGGIARVQPGLDTVQEFRIETVGSDARYSRPATVTLSTRSGTNEIHGALFETHRNNAAGLLARRREETGAFEPAKLIRNEFGASAGGPFRLPKPLFGPFGYDGRNKTFWFFAYEGLRNRQSSFVSDIVPTATMWNGNLSNIVDASGTKTIIYDPLTTTGPNGVRNPFAGNIIPTNRISPFAKLLQSLTAPPTNSKNPYLENNFERFYPSPLDSDNTTAKVDQTFSEKDTLSVRWTRSTRNATTEGGIFGNPIDVSAGFGTSRSDAVVNNLSINYNHTFSPTFLNELLVGAHRSYKSSGTLADFTDWPGKLGLPNPFGAKGWPTLCAGNFCWDADNRKDEALTAGIIENNATWNKGSHTIQFGGKIRKEWNNVVELQQSQGSHDIDGSWTALYDPTFDAAADFTGDGFASLLLGLPSFLSNQFNRGFFYFRQSETGFYFSDRWKVTPRLTLTLGMRWDKWTPYREKYNRMVVPDINTVLNRFEVVTPGNHRIDTLPGIPPSVLGSWSARGLTYTTARQANMPDGLFAADNNNFGPRIGAAFKITNKLILRGGYGEYFWTMPLSQLLQTSRTNPPLNLRFVNDIYAQNSTFNYPLVTGPTARDFIGQATVNTQGIVPISPSAQGVMLWDARNWQDGRAQSWHATVEYELPLRTALRVSYIGEHGRDLEQRFAINNREGEYNYVARTKQAPPSNRDLLRANPNWNVFQAADRSGYSNTHLGQIEIERRFSNGLALQWFYVYTRSLTTTDQGGFTSGNVGINSGGGGGMVPENIQLLGAPNMSYDQRLRLVYFNSTNVPPHRIRYNGIYELPFGSGKKFMSGASKPLNTLVGGWQVSFIGEWRSGFWSSIDPNLFVFEDPRLSADQRVELTYQKQTRMRLWFRGDFNPADATNVTGGSLTSLVPEDRSKRAVHPLGPGLNNRLPQTLADGTVRNTAIGELYNPSPRAFFLGPGAWNVDMGVYKNFKIKEKLVTRFSADFFNAFNHPVDVAPNVTTGLQDLSKQANNPRTIQFSFRIEF